MPSLAGHLLVASAELMDPNFVRSVVLLIHHNSQGAFGVVLNRPAESTVKELWEQVAEQSCELEQFVYMGGPVSGPLIAIHTIEALSEIEILPGLYFAAQRDHLQRLVGQQASAARFFVGHSGWGSGQLEREIKEGSWLTTPASLDLVFYEDVDLWRHASQRIGERMLSEWLKIKAFPSDPSVN